jgi:hypothetical protein
MSKAKNEGTAYNGPIILWWSLNENGPRLWNTFIIKLGPHWNWNAKKPKSMHFPYNFYYQLEGMNSQKSFIHVGTPV